MSVDLGRLQTGVAEQILNDADVVAGLQQMGGKGVAEGMGSDFLGDFCLADGKIKRLLEMRFMEMRSPVASTTVSDCCGNNHW